MALNVTQVNQAFLGLLGRPATGAEATKFAGNLDVSALAQTILSDASFKDQLSVEALSFKTVDLLNIDPAAFVESLYTALLGRASDAEGKAFWLSAAGVNPNRAEIVSQFIAAIQAQEGTADANAFASIQAEDKALANAWVESLYNNLAGRASDAEGLDFWSNAIVSFAMTPAQVAASFAAALAAQGNTTEDGQNYLAKAGVADNFTASFKDFNALITANEKTEQLKNLVTMMNGVNKDSQAEQYTEEITKIVKEYQSISAVQFTTADDDNLGIDPETGESNLSGAANFTGTYNLTDATKGTIQSSDSATGTEAYLTDTLTINVTGYDKTTHDTFELSELPSTSSVEKLVINNGAANVNGSVNADFQYINVNGTGSFNITASTNNTDGLKDISLNSAAGKENIFKTSQDVQSIKTGAGDDNIDLSTTGIQAATILKSLSTGAGKDTVRANIGKDATADLGAGDDAFSGSLGQAASLNAGAGDDVLAVWGAGYRTDSKGNIISEVKIDGGTGTDTLDLTKGYTTIQGFTFPNTEFRGIESIKGIEKVVVGDGTKLYATAISGQKIELSGATGSNLVLDASNASTVDLTKFTNAEGSDVTVRIENVKSGNVNLETGTKNFNAIKETISIAKDASKVSVKGFEQGNDHIEIEGTKANTSALLSMSGDKIVIDTAAQANNIYFVSTKEKLTITDLNNYLANNGEGSKFTSLQEKDVFYIVATDDVAPVSGGTAGTSSTAKVIKVEVGKDGKVGKLDQISTVNVADKGKLAATDFNVSSTYTEIVHVSEDAASGSVIVTVPADADAKIVEIDLSNIQNADKLTSLEIKGVSNGKSVVLTGLPNNADPVEVKFDTDANLGNITTLGGSANVTLGATNSATAISLNGSNDKLTLADANYTSILSIVGAETIKGETNTKVNLSALPRDTNNKLVQFDLEGTLTVVTAEGDKVVDASSIRDISTELIIDATAGSGDGTFIGSTTHVSGGQVTEATDPFVSVNLKDRDLTSSTTKLKDVNIESSGTTTVTEAQIKGDSAIAQVFKGAGTLKVLADGKDGVDLSGANFTVANATIQATNDVAAAIKGLTSGNTTLALGAGKGITKDATLADIDVVKLSGTNNIVDTELNALASASTKIDAATGDKITTETSANLSLESLAKVTGGKDVVVDITATASSHTVTGKATDITENVYLGSGTGKWDAADMGKYTTVDKVYATGTELVFASEDKVSTSTKLDLGNVDAKITISAVTAASSDGLKVSDYFTNIGSGDTITLSAVSNASASAGKVVATVGKDVITLASNVTQSQDLTIDLGDDAVVDTLNASTVAKATASALPTKILTVRHANAGDQIKIDAAAAVDGDKWVAEDAKTGASLINAYLAATKTGESGARAAETAVIVQSKDGSEKYLVYAKAADASELKTDDIVIKLSGTVDSIANVADGLVTLA